MRMVDTLKSLSPQHGGFLTNCQAHCQAGEGAWHDRTIDGTSMSAAFMGWYNATMQRLDGSSEAREVRIHASNSSAAMHRYYEACDSVTTCGTDKC
jgi:hypothetical protein